MADETWRHVRDRFDDMPRRPSGLLARSASFVGRVINGGSMPTSGNHWFIVNPVGMDPASQAEGASWSATADSARNVPVLFIGSRVPTIGDMAVCYNIWGIWVSDMGAASGVPCSPCNIPNRDLTFSWANSIIGDGSAPMVYYAPILWRTGCVNELVFVMECYDGVMLFNVEYFVSGRCPTGSPQYCYYPGASPYGITLVDYTCSPYYMHFQIVGSECPPLSSSGYTDFYVSS